MLPSGPSNARVMIVGEAPGEMEVIKGVPFVGSSGQELDRMLHEAGIMRSQCFVTNVCNERPPGNNMGEWLVHTKREPGEKYANRQWVQWKDAWAHPAVPAGYDSLVRHIKLVRPNLVIALGNTALFALTGEWGIKKWRGSQLVGNVDGFEFKVIPAYHPAAVLRDWSTRAITVLDLRRAAREMHTALPYVKRNYPRIIRPNYEQVTRWMDDVELMLSEGPVESSTDIETRAGHIACWGAHIRGLPTICIPFMCVERPTGYWTEDEEVEIFIRLRRITSHPNFKVIGQNWGYDSQYHWRWWFVKVPVYWDTMITQHCIYPGQPKGLDYLASMFNEFYRYWKDDGKNWDDSVPEDEYWAYNCDDTENTMEVYEAQKPIIENNPRLKKIWDFQTNRLARLLFKAMIRGIRADTKNKARLSHDLEEEVKRREEWLNYVLGHPINWNSPPQMKKLFYEDLKQRVIYSRKGEKGVTTDDEALQTIAKRSPQLRELITKFQELRSLGVFKSTFVDARLDRDGRIRCSFNIGGTVTFRLSSSQNAFGSGLNLQNIPSGNEDDELDLGALELPNVRKLFIPDEEQEIFDIDLKNADFYTVVWETDDDAWRAMLEAGVDQHLFNAAALFPVAKECTLERLKDPEFVKYAKDKYKKPRGFAKIWCHGTNYYGQDRTMAGHVGITVQENFKMRMKWFGEHPGLKAWHERTKMQIETHRYVENRFGYRWNIFDRTDGVLPEALAWVPQSTTGCVINRAWDRIDQELRDVEVMIQVHDSLVGQYHRDKHDLMLTRIPEVAKIVVPYDRPLVIPVGMKTSTISWGHCE